MTSPENLTPNLNTLGTPMDHDSEMEDVKNESHSPVKNELPMEQDVDEEDQKINSEASEEEALGADMIDSNVTQEASHAKCIQDLSFTKFKWNLTEDFTRFHRPDIQLLYDREKFLMQTLKE
jgi:hypothetical protein